MKNVLAFFILFFAIVSCDRSPEVLSFNGRTMGTTYSVKFYSPKSLLVDDVKKTIEETLVAVNKAMSTYDKQSELSRINYSDSTDWRPVSDELYMVVAEAKRIEELTAGAFDVTVGPAVNLWGFGPDGERKVPADQAVQKAMKNIGGKQLSLDQKGKRLKKAIPGLYIDLSAIAKGYGVDRVGHTLEALGIENYMVEIGGEVRTRGTKPKGDVWRIAIEAPEQGRGSYARILDISGMSIATSGNYRNFFESQGKSFSHTINPTTGRPVEHQLISASVVDENCMTADALATALMVLGPDKGKEFIEDHSMISFLIYQHDGEIKTYSSKRFDELFGGGSK